MAVKIGAGAGAALWAALFLSACAQSPPSPQVVQAPPPSPAAVSATTQPAAKIYKRKIAIGRFTNETRYGKALLTGDQIDPLGRQTSDMLSARLVESGKYIVLERPDLIVARNEQQLSGMKGNFVGTDTLIVGSLTEFGRAIEAQSGFVSNTKKQVARAKVELRLVDVRTGRVFFSASGSGSASTEAGTVFGFGSEAGYDATLNDRAIGAAISDVLNELISKLEERPWRSDILKTEGNRIFISGGERQGVKPGDELSVMEPGDSVRSGQSGFDIDLPPSKVAEIIVDANFGNDETNEGSICHVVSGTIPSASQQKLFVVEASK
jgi:curli biogenesis system outer membrane secretion channel CsgG